MFKTFTQYLLESEEKTYEFRIKIADLEVDNDLQDQIEHALSAFDVIKLSKPKRLPIQDKTSDFPSLTNCQVSMLTATLKYPCNDAQVLQALSSQGRIPASNLRVIPANQPEELQREAEETDADDSKKEAVLSRELEKTEDAQPQVGQKRVDSMLKDLAKDSTKLEFEKTEKVDSKSTNDLPQNNKSPMVGRKGN